MKTNGTAGTGATSLVDGIAAELGDVRAMPQGRATEYHRGQQLFAVVEGNIVTLRLRPDIAEAALRTPGTAPSSRGPEWIEFMVKPADPQDVDRLRAWLTIGWRAAQRPN
jgi:hypothetical protein